MDTLKEKKIYFSAALFFKVFFSGLFYLSQLWCALEYIFVVFVVKNRNGSGVFFKGGRGTDQLETDLRNGEDLFFFLAAPGSFSAVATTSGHNEDGEQDDTWLLGERASVATLWCMAVSLKNILFFFFCVHIILFLLFAKKSLLLSKFILLMFSGADKVHR